MISAISKRVQSWTAALLDPPHSREIKDHRGIKISDHWRLNRPLPREVAPLEDPEPKNLKKKNTIGDTGLCIYFMMTFLKKKKLRMDLHENFSRGEALPHSEVGHSL